MLISFNYPTQTDENYEIIKVKGERASRETLRAKWNEVEQRKSIRAGF